MAGTVTYIPQLNSPIWVLKGCSRCGGDLYGDRDMDGRDVSCLQCGYCVYDVEIPGTVAGHRHEAQEETVELAA